MKVSPWLVRKREANHLAQNRARLRFLQKKTSEHIWWASQRNKVFAKNDSAIPKHARLES